MASTAPIAAVIIARKRREIIEAFRASSATSPERAKTLSELGLKESNVFRIQVWQKAIVQSGYNRYYLDEVRMIEVDHQRRRKILFSLLASIVVLIIYFLTR